MHPALWRHATPVFSAEIVPPIVQGAAHLAARLLAGESASELGRSLSGPFASEDAMIAAAFDTQMLSLLSGQREIGLALQEDVLAQQRLYRVAPGAAAIATRRPIRLLGIAAPGDLQTNMPIEFIVAHLPVLLDIVFIAPGEALPEILPEHDLAMCLVGDGRPGLLLSLAEQMAHWPTQVINHPARILQGRIDLLSREGMSRLFAELPGILVPQAITHTREAVSQALAHADPLAVLLPGGSWPILVRPEQSHAGQLLERLENADELAVYLDAVRAPSLTLSQFVDYSQADGFFRKRRVALIDGAPFLCHMAISSDWMIHYVNAGMLTSPHKRAQEAAAMAQFDHGFAARHRDALALIQQRLGLDYLLLDCAEAPDGRLLVFEVELAAVIHALDPVDLFAYKQPVMQRVFAAFHRMLQDRMPVAA